MSIRDFLFCYIQSMLEMHYLFTLNPHSWKDEPLKTIVWRTPWKHCLLTLKTSSCIHWNLTIATQQEGGSERPEVHLEQRVNLEWWVQRRRRGGGGGGGEFSQRRDSHANFIRLLGRRGRILRVWPFHAHLAGGIWNTFLICNMECVCSMSYVMCK